MKKIILFLITIFLSIPAFSQLILENTYPSASRYASANDDQQLYILKLEVDGDKVVFVDRVNKSVKLYNLNHTLWKTISFAGATDLNSNYNGMAIMYISQHLFDADDEIEFLYNDKNTSFPVGSVTQVINEDGSILFTAIDQGPFVIANAPQAQLPIYNTSAGTKLILSGTNNDSNAYIYSLVGTLANGIKGYTDNEQNNLMALMAYPNPTNSSTRIDYTLPNGVNTGEIVFYDTRGKEVKHFKVDNTFNSLLISTEDLQSGLYYYNLQTAQGNSGAKKLVTVK